MKLCAKLFYISIKTRLNSNPLFLHQNFFVIFTKVLGIRRRESEGEREGGGVGLGEWGRYVNGRTFSGYTSTIALYRMKIREKFNLKGSLHGDCCMAGVCSNCLLCQLTAQLAYEEEKENQTQKCKPAISNISRV